MAIESVAYSFYVKLMSLPHKFLTVDDPVIVLISILRPVVAIECDTAAGAICIFINVIVMLVGAIECDTSGDFLACFIYFITPVVALECDTARVVFSSSPTRALSTARPPWPIGKCFISAST